MSYNKIIQAVKNNDLNTLKILVNQGFNPAVYNSMLFKIAVTNNNLDIINYLILLKDIDPATCDNFAIRYAARCGYLEVVKLLASLPCVDITACDNEAIRSAIKNEHQKVIEFLSIEIGVRNNLLNFNLLKTLKSITSIDSIGNLIYLYLVNSVCPKYQQQYENLIYRIK